MRVFTAISLPKEIKDKLRAITRGRLPVPYINIENLHITLNFLGELNQQETEKAKRAVLRSVKCFKKFAVVFNKITKFRNQIHVTLKENNELRDLQSMLEEALRQEGFNLEIRKYYPHIKFSNLHMDKVMHPERKLIEFPNHELEKLGFTADKVALYKSELLLHHVKYTLIRTYKLV